MRVYLLDMRGETAIELEAGCTLRAFARAYSPFSDDPVLAAVNGAPAIPPDETVLHDGDRVCFYPLLIGG